MANLVVEGGAALLQVPTKQSRIQNGARMPTNQVLMMPAPKVVQTVDEGLQPWLVFPN